MKSVLSKPNVEQIESAGLGSVKLTKKKHEVREILTGNAILGLFC